ncbi:MAG: Crp/Fnr family transcriptional regulator [Bacteroidetes bacterium]|nr:Crp/Fnr family transcriptional regulator [Bacteroidota bacterium]
MNEHFGPFGSESAYLFHEMIKEAGDAGEAGRKSYKKGEVIFEEDRHPAKLYCVIHGKVKVSRLNETGREQIVRLYGPNEVLGYKSLVMESPYHASATALEETQLGFVSKSAFDRIIDTNPRIARLFMKILCQNLDESENQLVSLASKNIRERVAGALVLLQRKFGLNNDKTLGINLSREEIAGMIGIATENLSRTLSQFRDEGIIDALGRKIVILDTEQLEVIRGEI